jgi:hypothetical protein
MPGLVPGIHVFKAEADQNVDGRDKPGHDELLFFVTIYIALEISRTHRE